MTPRRGRPVTVAFALAASLTAAMPPGSGSAQAAAEEFPVPARTKLWLVFGYGRATPYEHGVLFGLSGSRSGHLVGARAAMSLPGFDNGALDVGILYGRRWERPRGFLAFSGGPAYVEAIDGGAVFASSEISKTLGAAFAGEGVLTFGGFLGIGGHTFLNLNSLDSFGGLVVAVYLGRVE
ncbi:MAG TPA: hypothetical protein VK837_14385 [Longimicrobiales bacterium]|nr:hypothetical protein [Longimicrobiales bacterium]